MIEFWDSLLLFDEDLISSRVLVMTVRWWDAEEEDEEEDSMTTVGGMAEAVMAVEEDSSWGWVQTRGKAPSWPVETFWPIAHWSSNRLKTRTLSPTSSGFSL